MRMADESGSFDWPLDAKPLAVPDSIELDGEGIRWKWEKPKTDPGREGVAPFRNLLTGFLNLVDAPPERILSYARRWGVFEVCEGHGGPGGHPPEAYREPAHLRQLGVYCPPTEKADGWKWEPLSFWHTTSRKFRAAINMARLLHRRSAPSDSDWKELFLAGRDWREAWIVPNGVFVGEPIWGTKSVEGDWGLLANHLRTWLRLGQVRPFILRRNNSVAIELGGNGLFGALAAALLPCIARTEGFSFCCACGKPYVPDRRPASSKNRFCQSCGHPAAVRAASRAYQDRRKQAFQLHQQGVPPDDIARQLGRKTKIVRGWIHGQKRGRNRRESTRGRKRS